MRSSSSAVSLVYGAMLLCSHAASAEQVAGLPVTVTENQYSAGAGVLQDTVAANGTGVLDSNGSFTAQLTGTLTIQPQYAAEFGGVTALDVTYQDTFLGRYSDGVLTPTSGSSQIASCAGSTSACAIAEGSVSLYTFNSITGSIDKSDGGTVDTTGYSLNNIGYERGTYVIATGGGPTVVPLPAPGLLLGFGLFALWIPVGRVPARVRHIKDRRVPTRSH